VSCASGRVGKGLLSRFTGIARVDEPGPNIGGKQLNSLLYDPNIGANAPRPLDVRKRDITLMWRRQACDEGLQ
jgi:hypothetical protein